jgi:Flp pilus assembly protein TadD
LPAPDPNQTEVLEGLGFAYYLTENCHQALPRLERAMALRPPGVAVLNASGGCHQELGRLYEAREMFELSLSANPGQDAVRMRLSELSGR